MCSPACIRVTIRILKILGYILFGILAITSALCFLCVSYVTLLIMLPPLERVHIHYMTKLTRYLGYDNYERWDPNAKFSAWGTPYDAACGEIRMVLLKLDCMEPASTCMEKIEMFERDEWIRMDRSVQEKIFHNVSKECFQAMTCMTDLACREATYQFNIFHKVPHNFFLNHSSFSNCMARFMKVVRNEGSNHNCTRDFQFLSNNPIYKNQSFYHGRDCFLNVTREFCAPDVLYYLDSYYEFFLKFAMTPTENGCGIYEKILSLDCQDSMEYFRESVVRLKLGNQTKEDYLEVAELCDNMQNCINNLTTSCAISSEFKTKTREYCDKMHFLASPFWQCIQRLKTENVKPDLMKYACLIGHELSDDSTACQRFSGSSECIEGFMMDQCGFESVDGFEDSLKYLLEMWDC
ncbi:hypothetical protein B9Z55_020684 [Caenorhabditis nigoni]|uniref:T20D4.11-like domain-containing protein n=1 Tax=Caenorhabditis nigoni TaxID=1611254 RepID=A0A2G5TNN6_9PELO|nr:hypothetical protein B9Z55_020684 [Caenorhabditis nigoni]